MATAAFEETLDLEEERRALRRTETWIFFRAFLLLMFVILVVLARSIVL